MKSELASSLNVYLANVGVLYVKLHNLHWNVVGKDFKPVHEYLETLYDGFADVFDAVAETLKMHDVQPLASLKDYLAVATIQEVDSVELHSSDVLTIVQADLTELKTEAEAIRKGADADDLYDVVGLMEDQLEQYNKTLWFLKAMLK